MSKNGDCRHTTSHKRRIRHSNCKRRIDQNEIPERKFFRKNRQSFQATKILNEWTRYVEFHNFQICRKSFCRFVKFEWSRRGQLSIRFRRQIWCNRCQNVRATCKNFWQDLYFGRTSWNRFNKIELSFFLSKSLLVQLVSCKTHYLQIHSSYSTIIWI